MILYGISIADPAKKNLEFDSKRSGDGYNIERKVPGLPLPPFTSEQTGFRRFPEDELPSPTGIPQTDVSTIPVTETKVIEEMDLYWQRRNNLFADVEQPQLEAAKSLVSTGNNGGAFFDPKGINPTPTFKKTLRQTMRFIVDPASKIPDEYGFAEKCNYVYNNVWNSPAGNHNYQDHYYKNSSWKDSHGRIHLFERPFTRNFA